MAQNKILFKNLLPSAFVGVMEFIGFPSPDNTYSERITEQEVPESSSILP